MAEYIEREAAIKLFNFAVLDCLGMEPTIRAGDIIKALESIPATDVRPVVRGTWVGIDDFPHEDWECDHCGCVVGNTDDPWNYYHFCPNCGADMRAEEGE